MKTKKHKEAILNSLSGKFKVDKIEKVYLHEGAIGIRAEFSFGGRSGSFTYTIFGDEMGVDECCFDEKDDDDIYQEIHDWINEHISSEAKIWVDDKELK